MQWIGVTCSVVVVFFGGFLLFFCLFFKMFFIYFYIIYIYICVCVLINLWFFLCSVSLLLLSGFLSNLLYI